MVLAAGAFAHLSEDYLTGDPIVRWDVDFAHWLHAHAVSPLVTTFQILTWAGNVAVLLALVVGAVLLLIRRGSFNEAVLLLLVAGGIELLNAALKLVFHRPRPELSYVHLDTYSFPSGHAAGAAAVYGVLAFLMSRRGGRRRSIVCGVAFVALVGTIGFSRLYLEAHYLSDVLAGVALGLFWLCACVLVYLWLGRRSVLQLLPDRVSHVFTRAAHTDHQAR